MKAVKFKVQFTCKGRGPVPVPAPVPEAAPMATDHVPAPPPVVTSAAARQLALAHWIDRRIEAGDLRDLADAARLLGVTRARMTQIANLRLLPIDVQERVLAPGFRGTERSLRGRAEPRGSRCRSRSR